jgi:long-chain acyl-CoA synthetase
MFYTVPNEIEKNTFLIDSEGNQIRYKEFLEIQKIFQKGIDSRVVVLVLCESTPGSVMGVISFLMNGQIPLLLESNIEIEFISELISRYHIEYVFVSKENRTNFVEFEEVKELRDFVLLKTVESGGETPHNDLALLLTTSGSTGSPKLVRLSYQNIASNGRSIIQYLKLHENDRAITTLPLSYSFGFSILNSHFLVGASIVLTQNSVMEREFWTLFERFSPTSLSGVPFTFEMLKRIGFFAKKTPPNLKMITQAGGKMSDGLVSEINLFSKSNDIAFFVMYGQTEATARISYLDPRYTSEKIGSIGIAIPGGRLQVIQLGSNIELEPNTVGELVYSGPNVMLGYADNRLDLVKGDELLGRLPTGDLAKVDQDGFHYVVGRIKRILKVYGRRVNLDEVEVLLKKQFGNVACQGLDDNLVIFTTGDNAISDIKKYASIKFKLNHLGLRVIQVAEFPRLSNGKINYKELEELINEK